MSERIGICESCGTKYGNIPDHVTATKIKCKKCEGIVNIPALTAAEPFVAPPAKPDEPTAMDSKLESRPVTPKRPVRRPDSAKPVDRKLTRPQQPKPVAPAKPVESSSPEPPAKKSGAELLAAIKAKKSTAAASTDPIPPASTKKSGAELLAELKAHKSGVAGKQEKTPAGAASTGMADRQFAAKAKPGSDMVRQVAAKPKRGGHRKHPHTTKGVPAWITMVAVLVLGGAGGMLWYINKLQNEDTMAETQAEAPTPAATDTQPTEDLGKVSNQDDSGDDLESAQQSGSEGESTSEVTTDPIVEAPPAPVEPAESAPFDLPVAGDEIVYSGITDPDLLTLELVTPLPKWEGCDDALWADIQEDLELYLEDAGAQSNRAGNRLVEAGRPAFPALVNAMLKTNWADADSVRLCSSLNILIQNMSAGSKNFGWESIDQQEEGSDAWSKAILWDKKVVAIWHNQWLSKFSVNDSQWIGFAEKKTQPKAEEAKKEAAPPSFDDEFDD